MWLEKRKDDEAGSVSGFSNIFCVEKQQNNILGPLNFCMIACFLDHCRITFLAKKICNVKGHHFEFYWHRWPKQNFPTIFSILEILITWPALISYFSDIHCLPVGPSEKSQSSVTWVHGSPLCIPAKHSAWGSCIHLVGHQDGEWTACSLLGLRLFSFLFWFSGRAHQQGSLAVVLRGGGRRALCPRGHVVADR